MNIITFQHSSCEMLIDFLSITEPTPDHSLMNRTIIIKVANASACRDSLKTDAAGLKAYLCFCFNWHRAYCKWPTVL